MIQELPTRGENLCYQRARTSFNFTSRVCQEVVNAHNTLNTEMIVVFYILPVVIDLKLYCELC